MATETPQDAYLLTYTQISEADLLASRGQTEEARRKYEEAWHRLKRLEKESPDWEPTIVRYRLQSLSKKLGLPQLSPEPSREKRQPVGVPGLFTRQTSASASFIPILEIEVTSRRDHVPVNEEKIRRGMISSKGNPFSLNTVDQDIRNLYGTGDYENVQIVASEMRSEEGERGVRLTVAVDPKPILSEVVFATEASGGGSDGKPVLSVQDLPLDEITVGRQVGGEVLHRQAVRWEKKYREKGFPEVRITPLVENKETGTAKVTFRIHEGPRSLIRQVSFSGNDHVPAKDLEKVIQLKPAPIWSRQGGSDCFDPEKAEEDREKIRDLLQNRGFLDAQVSMRLEKIPGGTRIHHQIVEGERYGVEKITVEGMEFFKENDLLRELREKGRQQEVFDPLSMKMVKADGLLRGRPYSAHGLQASIETLQKLYGQHGFREAKVSAKILEAGGPKQALRVHFDVHEGGRSFVAKVAIQGNRKVPDQEIRSRILLGPGDVLDLLKENQSKENLLKTGYYLDVKSYTEETERSDRRVLIFDVAEKRQELSFGLGVGYIWNGGPERGFVLAAPFPALISFNLSAGWGLAWMQMQKIFQDGMKGIFQKTKQGGSP